MLKYIIEFLFCSGLFMALYKLLIERRVSHSWARKYLVAAMFLSFIIPTLELPLYPGETVVYEIPVFTPSATPKSDIPAYLDDSAMPVMEPQLEKYAIDTEQTTTYEEATSSTIDWAWVLERAIWAIYFIIVVLNLARFAWRIYIIYKLRRHSQLTIYELYTLAVNEQVREPFSFWRTIYMNRSMLSAEEYNQVISHELSHIRHHHTAERLVLELLRCVAWFNPFVWLAGSALVEVHEWQADSDVLNEGYDVYEYRQLIFRQLFGYNPDMTSGLGSSHTSKKRFLMMTDFKKGKYSFLRLGATLPLVAAMILAFGAVRAETEIVIKQPAPAVEVTDNATPSVEVVDDPAPAQDSTAPIVCDEENPSTEPALISESDGDEEYNRKFTQATPLITLNHGTYACVGYGLSDRVNQAETTALTKSVLATTFKVVSDTEIDVTTDAGWDFLKSGRYTYTLTRDTFTLKNKDASYSFKCEFKGPLFKAVLELIFDKQHEYFRKLIFIGPRETKDKEVRVSFGPNGTVYFNGEQTTIEELREKHYMNFNAPIVQPNGALDGNLEDVIKEKAQQTSDKSESQPIANPVTLPTATTAPAKDDDTPFVKTTDIIRLTVDDKYLYIKEGDDKVTNLRLAEISDDNFFPLVHKFITKKASSKTIEQKWASGKAWSYPVSNAVIVVDAKDGASVGNVRRVQELAHRAVVRLRVEVLKGQTKTVYGRLCEKDCQVLERAIPMNVIVTPEAQQILDISPKTDVIHTVTDQQPRFNGKEGQAAHDEFKAWANNYLSKNKNLKKIYKNLYLTTFPLIIEKDGSITLEKDLGFEWGGYDNVRDLILADVCAAAPKWEPAMHNGKPVRMKLDKEYCVVHVKGKESHLVLGHTLTPDAKSATNSHSAKSVPRGVVENPKQKVLNDDDRCKIKITKVTLTDEQTVVDLHVEFWHNWWINIGNTSILQTHERIYPIQDVKGATMDVKYWMPESGKATFQLIFPPIECKTNKITFGEKGSWCIEDIDLSNLRPINEQEHAATPPHLADGEYRPIGVIKKPSQDDGKDVVDKARELLPIIKVKGDKIIVEGNHYKDFVEPGKYTYQILDDGRILINGTGVGYNFPYEYATLSTGANMLDIMIPINVGNTQIKGVMYTRQEWED
ncbi:MAG: M56 family metallopeptidase [Alistipes sp.]|nr:M56 family metallopeptidase [Alistipes sp.]